MKEISRIKERGEEKSKEDQGTKGTKRMKINKNKEWMKNEEINLNQRF